MTKPSEELLTLATEAVDGQLSDEQYARLSEIVAQDQAAARWFVSWMEINALLQYDFGSMDGELPSMRQLLPATTSSLLARSTNDTERSRAGGSAGSIGSGFFSPRRQRMPLSVAVMAVSLMLVASFSFWLGTQGDYASNPSLATSEADKLDSGESIVVQGDALVQKEVATVVASVDAVFSGGLQLGSRVQPGLVKLESGAAELRFDNGAVIVLEGPAELSVVDRGNCQLVSGSMSVDVRPDASGFSVAAAGVRVANNDARFGVRSHSGRAAEFHALGGELHLVSAASHRSWNLTPGRAVSWDTFAGPSDIQSEPGAFITQQEIARRQRQREQFSYARWRDFSQQWRHDPDVVLHYDFAKNLDGAVLNAVNPSQHIARSQQQSPRWVRGRWADKDAMLFDGQTDRLQVQHADNLSIDGELTLATWIRVRSYPDSAVNRIVGKGSGADRNYGIWIYPNGSLLWQVLGDQEPQSQNDWDRFSLSSEPAPLHEWLLVTGVVEAGKMKLYVNGRLESLSPAPAAYALSDAPLTIGYYGDVPSHDSWFCGEIGEMLLMRRALTAEEISKIYEVGRPAVAWPSTSYNRHKIDLPAGAASSQSAI